MKESFEDWYGRLEKTCKKNGLEWILTDDAEDYREDYDENLTIDKVINEVLSVIAEDSLYSGN